MKTWYLLVVLAVIFVFAVCRFNAIKTYFLRKPFLWEIRNSRFCIFFEYHLILHPEHTGSIHKHPGFQIQCPSVSPDPFPATNPKEMNFFYFSFGFIWFPYIGPDCCLINSVNRMTACLSICARSPNLSFGISTQIAIESMRWLGVQLPPEIMTPKFPSQFQ